MGALPKKRTQQAELAVISFPTGAAWGKWLDRNHATSTGVWILFAKKGAGIPSVSYAEALDIALCHGWIDSQKQANDATTFLQKFTPRGPRSIWSRINRDKAIALTERGEMKPAGAAEIDRARKDGRWDAAYEPQARAVVPPDLQAALDRNRRAAKFFSTLTSQNRYAILFRIQTARRPETRAKRIGEFVAMLARHETFH